jgi:hypothetical protein
MPTLLTATRTGSGFNVKTLVVLAVIFALFYVLQKRLRAWASRQRIERWEHDDLLRTPPPVDEPPVQGPPAAPYVDEPPGETPGDGPTTPTR